jgi:hypothetical protein
MLETVPGVAPQTSQPGHNERLFASDQNATGHWLQAVISED